MKTITLTPAQWVSLQTLVSQGVASERSLGLPLEITNGDQKIEITAKETVIELDD